MPCAAHCGESIEGEYIEGEYINGENTGDIMLGEKLGLSGDRSCRPSQLGCLVKPKEFSTPDGWTGDFNQSSDTLPDEGTLSSLGALCMVLLPSLATDGLAGVLG